MPVVRVLDLLHRARRDGDMNEGKQVESGLSRHGCAEAHSNFVDINGAEDIGASCATVRIGVPK